MGKGGRLVRCVRCPLVPVSVLGLLRLFLGPNGKFLVGVIGRLMSGGWSTTTGSCMGRGMLCSGLRLIVLVMRGLKAGLISYCTIFLCSIG